MTELSDDQLFAELRKIDTPTITNVVATYPKNPLCLGLYNPWTENWYTDTSIRCVYPEMGAIIGYAVTCVYGLPDPNYSGRLSFMDVVDALDAMKKPTILVIQQKWPPELMNKAGLAGEMMATSMQAVGCVGLLSNGPSRDVDAIRIDDGAAFAFDAGNGQGLAGDGLPLTVKHPQGGLGPQRLAGAVHHPPACGVGSLGRQRL